ncbi:alpha/beta hydrolase [Ectobacillus ponti]|uniref:Lysophospholipase n=1 Tax=Ectobacillus ponti TaxID=2961894 RepID=A0AA41X235_9BACI|nr:alpha/beta hydrolase [Ectobacillus ponti]MCP8967521.1 lysophospholipase [Ectobacillus ponti]
MWKREAEQAKGVIVIVHGAMEHHGRYLKLADQWLTEGYHVIMGDLPGHGTTTRNRGHIDSFDEYIHTVHEWVKAAEDYRLPLFLLGHSMGGLIVIRFLQEIHKTVQGVVLTSPCLGIATGPGAPLRAAAKMLNVVKPDVKFPSNLTVEMATRNKEIRDEMENDSLYLQKVSVRWYTELLRGMEEAHEQIRRFPDVPLFIMQACEDKIVDRTMVRKWFDQSPISNKAYKEWRGCYHELFNEYESAQVFAFAKYFMEAQLSLWRGEST